MKLRNGVCDVMKMIDYSTEYRTDGLSLSKEVLHFELYFLDLLLSRKLPRVLSLFQIVEAVPDYPFNSSHLYSN